MTLTSNYKAKTALCAVFCGLSLIATIAQAQNPPATAAIDKDSREGLPDSYKGPASAVAAIVDDKVITTFDVAQRMKLMIVSSGREIPPEYMPQLQERALKDLIEENLKLKEAKEFDVDYEKKDVDGEIATLAGQAGVTVDSLKDTLESQGVGMDGLRQQITANMVWSRLVQGRYGSRVRVNDDDVEASLSRMRDDATSEQYLVSEICIPVTNPGQAKEIYEGSQQLIEQMRRGVPFAVVAQQFSACTSAAAGGDLGWVHAGELPPEIDTVIRELPAGSVTNPISSEGAFMILAVRDRRAAVVAGEPTFTLAYASAPLSMGRNDALLALEKLKTADACGGRALRQDLGPSVGVALLENVKVGDIDERFRDTVADLNRGDLSGPIEADGALHSVYVCEKDEGLGLPSRDALEDRLYSRQLERIGQQYLRDVERKTMVDVRLKSPDSQPNG